MSSLMYRRCALALFVAMLLASGCGLLALGPIDGPPAQANHGAWPERITLGALVALALWSQRQFTRAGRPACARTWAHGAAAIICIAGLQLWPPRFLYAQALEATRQALAGTACAWLVLGFLAERVSGRAAHPVANISVGILGALAVAWQQRYGDWSLLLWFQLTPLWLLPSGLQHLPGRVTRAGDWWVLVPVYLATRLGELLMTSWQQSIGILAAASGLAISYGWLGYRVSMRPDKPASAGDGNAGATQRKTSLNTSG
jgi:hypothetical protein